mmetsp:Transcript_23024/g.38099  ORF Transcript_23024/g.38099 Transcript_23024/m.38099 type:complete len:83 (+) Transcript_23024:72-320(+)
MVNCAARVETSIPFQRQGPAVADEAVDANCEHGAENVLVQRLDTAAAREPDLRAICGVTVMKLNTVGTEASVSAARSRGYIV